jgi:hypothetical protein
VDSAGLVTFTHVGPCLIRLNQAGDATYAAATQVTRLVDVGKAPQVLTVTSTPPTGPLVFEDYQISATGGPSGNPVTFSLDPSTDSFTCNVDDTGHVFFTEAGPCVVHIDQAGNADYLPAAQVTQSMTVGRHSQAITFTSTPPVGAVFGDTYQPTATGGGSGKPVTFAIDPGTDAGACVIDAGGLVHLTGVGTCVIGADQAGNTVYSDAPHVAQTVAVSRAPQVLTFTSTLPAHPVVGDTFQLSATGGGSGQPVTFSLDRAADVGSCVVDPNGLISFTGTGLCIVDADQVGDPNYLAAHASLSFTVAALPTPIPGSTPASHPAGGRDVGGVQASSALPFTGTTAVPLLGLAAALLVAGAVVLLSVRRPHERRHR